MKDALLTGERSPERRRWFGGWCRGLVGVDVGGEGVSEGDKEREEERWGWEHRQGREGSSYLYLRGVRLELDLSGSFLLLLYSVSNSSAVPMMFRSGSQVESAVE